MRSKQKADAESYKTVTRRINIVKKRIKLSLTTDCLIAGQKDLFLFLDGEIKMKDLAISEVSSQI